MKHNRLKEQISAAKVLGCEVEVLNIDPYEFSYNRKYIQIYDKIIKKNNPDLVFCCWNHDTHQDHQTLSKIIFSTLRKNNISLYQYEAMLPGGVNENSFNPNYYVDISKFIKKKINSIKQYKSVFSRKKNLYSNYFDTIIARARFRGGTIGTKYAESFKIVKKIEF
jgi:LmbE family N-acetylglucosaminyl deacetylase